MERAVRTAWGLSGGAGAGAGLAADYARCAAITRRASSNFYYAFALLPAERRRALYAVYAFCRFVDDIVDDGSAAAPAPLLERWREELERVYRGAPEEPVARALKHAVARFNLPRGHFEQIIAGAEMDLERTRYGTFEELRLYCYRVASAVGLICVEVFGCASPAARTYAEKLGIAFQLTNILRDVSEDAARGRIYLPREDLARFGVAEEEILRGVSSPDFLRLMEFQAERARRFYREAEEARPAADRSRLLAAEAMRLIYAELLESIARSNYQVFGRRHTVSAPRKLCLVGRAWAAGRLAALAGA